VTCGVYKRRSVSRVVSHGLSWCTKSSVVLTDNYRRRRAENHRAVQLSSRIREASVRGGVRTLA